MTQFTPTAAPPLRPPTVSLVTAGRDALAGGDDTNGRWVDGFAFSPALNVDPTLLPSCGSGHVDGHTPTQPTVETVPWFVTVSDVCSSIGFRGRDYIGRAIAAAQAATAKGLEFEFWAGELATSESWPNLFLTNGNATDVTPTPGTAVTVDEAIALLEQALADCGAGGQGMIHCAPIATPSMAVVRRDGPRLLTLRDTIVVPGVGYPGTGPAAETPDAGETWMFATGLVDVRVGDVDVYGRINGTAQWIGAGDVLAEGFDADRFAPAFLNRSDNTVTVPAARPVAAAWDGVCQFAVLAQIPTAP